ncbi:MAG: hypothetical protein F4048_07815 [Gammaproteobacteria bacterium]|nr:hypothetical protein [Gammaproteobacteria bacterium]MYK28566.1 hypothetical protein [Gammaproteobacteria bacterium]
MPTSNKRISVPLWFLGLASGPLAFGVSHYVFDSWGIAIGALAVIGPASMLLGGQLSDFLSMPRQCWYLIHSKFPPRTRVSDGNIDREGFGSLNGYFTGFEMLSDNESLTIKNCGCIFLRRDTVTIPWSKLKLRDVGLGYYNEHLAVLTVKGIVNCRFVVPWCEKFSECRKGAWRKQSNPGEISSNNPRRSLVDIPPEPQSGVPMDGLGEANLGIRRYRREDGERMIAHISSPTRLTPSLLLWGLDLLFAWVMGMVAYAVCFQAYGSLGLSLFAMTVVAIGSWVYGGDLVTYFSMPRKLWSAVVHRFPPKQRITAKNVDCVGRGAINGHFTYFWLAADAISLTIRISNVPYLRRTTATFPREEVELRAVGLGEGGESLAVLRIGEPTPCELVLPWWDVPSDNEDADGREDSPDDPSRPMGPIWTRTRR